MINAELIQKIKAEIERLKKDNEISEDKHYAPYELDVACGYDMALDDILSLLSTIESEKPNGPTIEEPIDGVLYAAACGIKNAAGKSEKPMNQDELEKEIDRIVKCEKDFMHFKFKSLISYIARHFAKWGAEHLKK